MKVNIGCPVMGRTAVGRSVYGHVITKITKSYGAAPTRARGAPLIRTTKKGFSGIYMGLVLLWKDSQCLIGPMFTPCDPPTCVIIVNENGCDSE